MDKLDKELKKLSEKERALVKEVLNKIKTGNFYGLDIKKLKGQKNVYRARKGKIRIIYNLEKERISILSIERRTDTTYK